MQDAESKRKTRPVGHFKRHQVDRGGGAKALEVGCFVCKMQGRATKSGRAVRTSYVCVCDGGCTYRGADVGLCPDTCFRIYHTEVLEGGGGVRSTQGRRKSSVDVDGSNSENSDTAGLRTQHR
jgi:hypothetical protein